MQGARRTDPGPTATAWGGTGRTRPDGRGGHQTAGHQTAGHQTAGHQTAGRWTGGHRPSGPPDPWTTTPGDRTPERAGHQTAGQPDPDDGTGWVDTAHWTRTGDRRHGWRPSWHCRPRRRRPTLDAGWTLRRADAVWAGNNPGQPSSKDYEGHHALGQACHRRDSQPLGRSAGGPAAPRRTALLR
jgi:hypothetical protein